MKRIFSIVFALALVLAFSLVAAIPAGANGVPPFNNPDYFYKRLLDTGSDGPRWPDYNAIAGKISWYQSGYKGYFADFDANTLELSNVTPFAPDKMVYITTFSKDGQYIYFEDVDDAHMTSLVVTAGTIKAYPAYRYNIAASTTELIFDISTIPAATIEALTSYVGIEFGFYLGPTDSNDEVLMCVRDGNEYMDIVSYNITAKTFVNLTDSAQAEYDGRYFGTDTSQLLYWTEGYPTDSDRSVAILNGGETVIDTKTSPDMYLSCRWGADQNHVMAMQGTGWSNTDLVMFTRSGGVWSTPPDDLTGDGWSATDGGLNVGAWIYHGFVFSVRNSAGNAYNGLWVAVFPPDHGTTSTGTGTASFTPSTGAVRDFTAVATSSLPPAAQATKPGNFRDGLFSFNVAGLSPGQAVNVTITLPSGSAPTQYWKYHASEGGWIPIPMTIVGPPNVIRITLVDGGLSDDDLTANGVIVDQGGPVGGGAVGWDTYPVNKLRVFLPWIALLVAIMAGASLLLLRRRRTQS